MRILRDRQRKADRHLGIVMFGSCRVDFQAGRGHSCLFRKLDDAVVEYLALVHVWLVSSSNGLVREGISGGLSIHPYPLSDNNPIGVNFSLTACQSVAQK